MTQAAIESSTVAAPMRGRTASRYLAVLKTYPRRWHFYVCLGVLLNYLLLVAPRRAGLRPDSYVASVYLIFMCLVVGAFTTALIDQLKEQFADWRAKLYPRFRVPHLAVGAILLATVIVLIPAYSAGRFGVDFWPLLMVSTLTAAAIGWAGYFPSAWTLLPIVAVISLFASATVRDAWPELLRGEHPIGLTEILLYSTAAFIALLARLGTLHEGRREYARAMPNWTLRAAVTGDPSTRSFGAAGRTRDPLMLAAVRYNDRRVIAAPRVFSAGFWWRVRHWRMVTANGWIARVLGVSSILSVGFMLGLVLFMQNRPSRSFEAAASILAGFALFCPPLIVGFLWPKRWLTIAYEASFPATRRQLVREVGMAMLRDHAAIWLWALITAYLLLMICANAVNAPGPGWNAEILAGVAALACGQALAFGLIVWALRFRSGLLSLLILFPACAATSIQFGGFVYNLGGMTAVALMPPVLGASGVLLAINAYRWWCRADLD